MSQSNARPSRCRPSSVEVLFFSVFFLFSGRDDFYDIHDIRAQQDHASSYESGSSHAFRSSAVIAGRIEASATGSEAIPDVTTYVAT